MDTSYLYGLEEDLFDFCDAGDYADSLDSPCSTGSDIENQIVYDPNSNHNNIKSSTCDTSGLRLLHNGKPPVKKVMQRKAANLRERRRMKSINDAFETLRTCIPAKVQAERRLSKVDTLRLAIRYIGYLSELVQTCNDFARESGCSRGPRVQEKVIVRCHLAELEDCFGDEQMLVGHSLSWDDAKGSNSAPNAKLVAKVWIPENPTESDLINLAAYSNDC